MTLTSKEETDFKRLLKKCEQLADKTVNCGSAVNETNWRLEKYIEALNQRLNQLKQQNVCPLSESDLSNYTKKVHFLNGLIESQMMTTSSDRLMAAQILSPVSVNPLNNLKSDKTKEIHLNIKSRAENEIRSELFSRETNELRRRNTTDDKSSDDFDAVVKYHHSIQEKVAEEMIELTRNLKHNATLSNDIIKKDTESLKRTATLAEGNTDSLRQNTSRISEFVRRSCQYWLWIMLFIVSFTFLWIVVFIRMFPKKYI